MFENFTLDGCKKCHICSGMTTASGTAGIIYIMHACCILYSMLHLVCAKGYNQVDGN